MSLPPEDIAWILFAAFAAGFIQGLSGFGSALVALPLLSLVLDIRAAVALVALLGLVVSVVNLLRHRDHLRLAPLYPLFVGALLGTAPGVLFLAQVPQAWIMLGLGLVLVGFATSSLAPGQRRTPAPIRSGLLMGLASGALGGAYATNGPPAILHIASLGWSAVRQKASLSAFFVATGSLIVVSHWIGGVTNGAVLWLFATALPALVIGMVAGIALFHRLSDHGYRRMTLGLVLLMGVMMLVRASHSLLID